MNEISHLDPLRYIANPSLDAQKSVSDAEHRDLVDAVFRALTRQEKNFGNDSTFLALGAGSAAAEAKLAGKL